MPGGLGHVDGFGLGGTAHFLFSLDAGVEVESICRGDENVCLLHREDVHVRAFLYKALGAKIKRLRVIEVVSLRPRSERTVVESTARIRVQRLHRGHVARLNGHVLINSLAQTLRKAAS